MSPVTPCASISRRVRARRSSSYAVVASRCPNLCLRLYTRAVFDEISTTGKLSLARDFAEDAWVFGSGAKDIARSGALLDEVLQLYEQDYIRAWDEVLRDVTLRPTAGTQELADVLAIAASSTSPLKGLLQTVARNTDLLSAKPTDAAAKAAQAALDSRAAQLTRVLGAPPATQNRTGASVAAHFAPLRELVFGGAADRRKSIPCWLRSDRHSDSCSRSARVSAIPARSTRSRKADRPKRWRACNMLAKQLPVPVGEMIGQIGVRTQTVAVTQARVDLASRYNQQVLRECRDLIEGRYPVNRASAADVPLADFGRVFGTGGVFDKFFQENLQPLVDTSREPWRWRQGAAPIGGSAALLRQFALVQRIRAMYFPQEGGSRSVARDALLPHAGHAGRVGHALHSRYRWPGVRVSPWSAVQLVRCRGRARVAAHRSSSRSPRRRFPVRPGRVHGPGSGCSIRRASSARATAVCASPSLPESAACV